MTFEQTIQTQPRLLMEAAIVERVRRSRPDLLDPRLVITPLVQSPEGRAVLSTIYREYISVAKSASLPLLLSTPTWRASRDRCGEVDLNGEAVKFMHGFKSEYSNLFIGGQIGCKNDCYKPNEALAPQAAADFHDWQIKRLAPADFLYAVTLPSLDEARGIAQAMAATDRPYLISFVIGKNGDLLDGNSLEKAIETIDQETVRPPLGYGANCCYPSFLQAATLSESTATRLLSIQANASSLTHAELEQADSIQNDPLEDWSHRMLNLHRTRNIRILGGCCGTTVEHLRHLT